MTGHRPPATRALALALALALGAAALADARRVLATVPYSLRAPAGGGAGVAFFAADGTPSTSPPGVGGRVVVNWSLLDDKGAAVGQVLGECTVVSTSAADARAVCQKHFEWDGGASAMFVTSTDTLSRGGSLVTGRLAILGGIGRWQGAHGEDTGFKFDWAARSGGGKIVLNCLDGVC